MKIKNQSEEVTNEFSAISEVDAVSISRVHQKGARRILIASIVIFVAAFGVRFLSWQDTRVEIGKIQSVVVNDYKRVARLLIAGGVASFFSPTSPLSNAEELKHPPGYSILLAVVYSALGESDTAVQLIQITSDSLSAVLIFLIAVELLPAGAGFIAGLLAAFSPQFAWNSVLLLPDSLAVFPLLLAAYCIARSLKRPHFLMLLAAGAFVGLSCWLRANALLLAPFLACACPILFKRGRRLRYAAALAAGTILVVAPLTIRNAIVFRHFIPVSLGAGQTFLEGIADYDPEGRFGVPATDMGILKWEAEHFNRPDYNATLFNPDGVLRERMRLKRGLKIVASHPLWFAGVMTRRAISMLRLERSRLIQPSPPVSHSPDATSEPSWTNSATELLASNHLAPQAKASVKEERLEITGNDSKYGEQFLSAPFQLRRDMDYTLALPVKILKGRMSVGVKSGNRVYASTIVETEEMKAPEEQPERLVQLVFVSERDEPAQLVISNAASMEANPVIQIGAAKLYNLGRASNTWTRYPRTLINLLQKLYITAVMLPLAIFGIILLLRRARAFQTLAVLLVIPAYYLLIQSATHTEYRYVLVIHYFLFALTALFIYTAGDYLRRRLRERIGS